MYCIVCVLSNLIKRILYCIVVHQYLAVHRLLPCRQSAYRRSHSTETVILDVLSVAFTAADEQQVTLMGLHDLSAAFDCVDYELLLHRLRQNFGFSGAVFEWLTSLRLGGLVIGLDWIVQCFTSPPTQYRLYGRRFLQVKRPNQQYQSTERKSTKENNPENKENTKYTCIHTKCLFMSKVVERLAAAQ